MKQCASCKKEFDDYYVRHFFMIGTICETCYNEFKEEDEDEN